MTLPSPNHSFNSDSGSEPGSGPAPEATTDAVAVAVDPVMPALLEVVSWPDPQRDGTGHDPRSLYAERFWLGLLGPSTLWMLRRFARGLETHPNGFRVSLADTGRSLGLGDSVARNSSTQRTITRLCQFGLALRIEPARLGVRRELPTLNRRQVARLPDTLQAAHDDWIADHHGSDDDRRRATAAATGLVQHGETFEIIERQLRSWGYPGDLAYAAARDAIATERSLDLR